MPKGFKTPNSGRKKGTPNKKTQNLTELIEENYSGFDPILELIAISQKDKVPLDLKVSILKDIAQYIYPRRKAIEADITAEANITTNKTVEEVIEEIMNNR